MNRLLHRHITAATPRWRVVLLAALTLVLGLLLPAAPASAAALPAAETRVGASALATSDVVGVHECITAGQRPVRGPSQLQIVVGNCVAAEAASGGRALLGNADDIVVLGRLDTGDTAVAKGWDGHVVLDTPNWSLKLNDEFIAGAIEQRRRIYLASPTKGNLVQTSGQFAGQPTVYARELNMLRQAGYTRAGDYMVPPS